MGEAPSAAVEATKSLCLQAARGFSPAAGRIALALLGLQDKLRRGLEQVEGGPFAEDPWQREEGGGGLSLVLSAGQVFEKAGVMFSGVRGARLPEAARQGAGPGLPIPPQAPFFACGVSLIMHPQNPYVPCVHFNVRYLEAGPAHWFGGGMDLTPCYPFVEDCVHFHRVAKACCERFDAQYYPRFKAWCDSYFYLKHRQEPRGIGGVFFNHLVLGAPRGQAFLEALGAAFLEAYLPLVRRRQGRRYGERERAFLQLRRGRYVEFNLIYDQGTLFGLQSAGRVESILVSMPPQVRWAYRWQPQAGSPEEALYTDFLPPCDWAGEEGRRRLRETTAPR